MLGGGKLGFRRGLGWLWYSGVLNVGKSARFSKKCDVFAMNETI